MEPVRGAAKVASGRAIGLLLMAALSGAATNACAGTLTDAARHSSTDYCSGNRELSPRVQDRLLRFAAQAQRLLEASGQPVALVARSGLDLQRFGHRYSHAGISLLAGAELPWAVRQLYYACDEKRPRLFDQGLAGFVFGTDNTQLSFLSLVMLPSGSNQRALLRTATDKPRALGLIAPHYSANAYAFSSRYQNCNQWVAELLGIAWAPEAKADTTASRDDAQSALRLLGYEPEPTAVGSPLVMLASSFVPLLNLDDHPEEDRMALRLRVSMPATIENFVRQREPTAQRIELCQTEGRIVIRRGWRALPADCSAEAGDEVLALD
jgi:hypothetical protein